ncbi:hypothetical protein ACQKWADRAFT_81199 [Trichoderma austrokoningii]
MTVSFFNIGHACPVQRSYELLLRVEILLSHTLFFFFFFFFFYIYRLRILSLVCLVIYIHTLYIICFSFLLLFSPLATRYVIIQGGSIQLSRISRGLIFFLAYIIREFSFLLCFVCFALAFWFSIWFYNPGGCVTEFS